MDGLMYSDASTRSSLLAVPANSSIGARLIVGAAELCIWDDVPVGVNLARKTALIYAVASVASDVANHLLLNLSAVQSLEVEEAVVRVDLQIVDGGNLGAWIFAEPRGSFALSKLSSSRPCH